MLLLRIKCRNECQAMHNFNIKFGCFVRQARALLAQAWAMKLNVVGVTFLTGIIPVSCYPVAIEDAYNVFKMGQELGFKMTILDIGGGYRKDEKNSPTFIKIAEAINSALEQFFPAYEGVRIIAEPGRFMTTTSFTLAVNIIGKKFVLQYDHDEVFNTENQNYESDSLLSSATCNSNNQIRDKNEDKKGHISPTANLTIDGKPSDNLLLSMYCINDGIFGSFANTRIDIIEGLYPKVLCRNEQISHKALPERLSIIWGPTCHYDDCVVPECKLPDLEIGQWMYFCNMGAYTISSASDFNSVERPLMFYVCSKHYWNKAYPQSVIATYKSNF